LFFNLILFINNKMAELFVYAMNTKLVNGFMNKKTIASAMVFLFYLTNKIIKL
jgi:hypothetical protein